MKKKNKTNPCHAYVQKKKTKQNKTKQTTYPKKAKDKN